MDKTLDVAEQERWQMSCGGGYSSGKKITGNEGVNLFGLLNCGKTLLPE